MMLNLVVMVDTGSPCCRMVGAGEIFAEIDASAGMVRFLEDPEQYTSTSAVQHLNATIQASFALAEKLQSINRQVHTQGLLRRCSCNKCLASAGLLLCIRHVLYVIVWEYAAAFPALCLQ